MRNILQKPSNVDIASRTVIPIFGESALENYIDTMQERTKSQNMPMPHIPPMLQDQMQIKQCNCKDGDVVVRDTRVFGCYVECKNYGCWIGPSCQTQSEAIIAWNHVMGG